MGRHFDSPISALIEQNMEVMATAARLYQAAKKSNLIAESIAAKQPNTQHIEAA